MKPEVKKCLYDINASIKNITDFIGKEISFEMFRHNILLRRAIERELEIIGEAVSRIMKYEPTFELKNSRKIIDTRNWVIHAYDNVDEVIIWGIVKNHLPELKQEVESYLIANNKASNE